MANLSLVLYPLPVPRKANSFLQKLSHGLSRRRRRFLQARGPSRRRPRPARALPYVHPCTASAPVKPVLPSRREGEACAGEELRRRPPPGGFGCKMGTPRYLCEIFLQEDGFPTGTSSPIFPGLVLTLGN
jgi:hypothetical protein